MNKITILTMKVLRKLYFLSLKDGVLPKLESDQNPDSVAKTLYDVLSSDEPCMIARFGSTELSCLRNYIGIQNHKNEFFGYVKGTSQQWWWEPKILNQMQQWSGFFPPTEEKIEQFCQLMINDISLVDVLGSWLQEERLFEKELKLAKKVSLLYFDPFWAETPWTMALEGKKVLIVHPFAQTIEQQYKKRKYLFEKNILPEFELKTIKAVQSIAGQSTPFSDWFQALEFMKGEIDKTDFDICLIGAGAYGFPLSAHVKRMGKKGFHLGGSLQLLFGIRGKRWERQDYHEIHNYPKLINDYWVRPGEDEKPSNAEIVEDACYW